MRQHDKIINKAARKVLAPQGLFRQGTSRIWLDDNGYFLTLVEFQPSGWSKGSYLNVGISFLWESSRELNELLAFDYGYRIKGFISYDEDDDKFEKEMEQFAETALQKVTEYRRFRDLEYAKTCLEQNVADTPEKRRFWEPYHLAMLCFLKGDFDEGVKWFDSFMKLLKNSFYLGDCYIEWHEIFYHDCEERILSCLTSKEAARDMVLEMIRRRRDFFSSKPSFKKMSKELFRLP